MWTFLEKLKKWFDGSEGSAERVMSSLPPKLSTSKDGEENKRMTIEGGK